MAIAVVSTQMLSVNVFANKETASADTENTIVADTVLEENAADASVSSNAEYESSEEDHEEYIGIESDTRILVKYADKDGEKVEDDNKIYVSPCFDAIELNSGIDVDAYCDELKSSNDNIEYIQTDYKLILSSVSDTETPFDMFQNTNSDLSVDITEPYPNSPKEDEVVIAVIDSGVDVSHEAISESIWHNPNETDDEVDSDGNGYIDDIVGWDFAEDKPLIYDETKIADFNHGTHIAGIIAGQSDEIQGIFPEAKVMPLKAFKDGSAYTSDIIKAINYAENMGASIANCSFGAYEENKALKETMENSSMIFVCASGNDSRNIDEFPVYPASYDLENVISVSATDGSSNLAYFSNYGECIDIAVNGLSVKSSTPENEYGNSSGTSSSAAYITGIVASILADDHSASVITIKERLLEAAVNDVVINDEISNIRAIKIDNSINLFNEDIDNIDNNESVLYSATQGGLKLQQISAGGYHSAVMTNNNAYIFGSIDAIKGRYNWGENDVSAPGYKMFGIAKQTGSPLSFVVKKISARGDHNLILLSDGTVRSIGSNQYGQLGVGYVNGYINNGTESTYQVQGLSNIVDIAAGHQFSMALDSSGRVYAWGNNKDGQVGNGNSYAFFTAPQLVSGITNVKSISAGHYHALAQKSDGSVYGWGRASNGALGELTSAKYYSPQPLNIADVEKIIAGTDNSFFIKSDKTVYAYGLNMYGQLGIGNLNKTTELTKINIENVSDISSNLSTIFLKEDGTAYGCGSNAYGQLGVGYTVTNERNIQKIPGTYTAISTGGNHTLFLKEDGLYAAGRNQHKQCGFSNFLINYLTPTLVEEFSSESYVDTEINGGQDCNIISGNTYIFAVDIVDMENIQNKIFTIDFDSSKLSLDDACAQTWKKDTAIGNIADTDITLLSNSNSQIQFKVNKPASPLLGTVNLIKFKAIATGTSKVTITVK